MNETIIGNTVITQLIDTHGMLGSYPHLFPDLVRATWEPYRAIYPELFQRNNWQLPFASFAVRTPDVSMLIDTGVGPPGADFLPEREGRLLDELRAAGMDAADVDVVFLTHLHLDHIGWNLTSSGAPTFPGATYVTHESGWRWAVEGPGSEPARSALLTPLEELGLLELVNKGMELAPGIDAIETPGHSRGI